MEKVHSFVNLVLTSVVVMNSVNCRDYFLPTFWKDRSPTCNSAQNASYCEITNVTIKCGRHHWCTEFHYNDGDAYPASEIRELVFKNTSMVHIPFEIFTTLTSLERIECVDCQIYRIPHFEEADNLIEINFSHNQIIFFNFEYAINVRTVNLAFNKIGSEYIDSFEDNRNLKVLYLQGNQLDTLNLNHVTLNILNVSHNAIEKFRLGLGAINIDASYNKITEFIIENGHDRIIELRLRQNNLRNILFVQNMTNLKHLDISKNQLKFIDAGNFEMMKDLQEILIEGNYLIDIYNISTLRKISEQHANLIVNLQLQHESEIGAIKEALNSTQAFKIEMQGNFEKLQQNMRADQANLVENLQAKHEAEIKEAFSATQAFKTEMQGNFEKLQQNMRADQANLVENLQAKHEAEVKETFNATQAFKTEMQGNFKKLQQTIREVQTTQMEQQSEILQKNVDTNSKQCQNIAEQQSKVNSELRASNKLLEAKLDAFQIAVLEILKKMSDDLSPLRNAATATADGPGFKVSNNITFNLL